MTVVLVRCGETGTHIFPARVYIGAIILEGNVAILGKLEDENND